MLTNFNNLIYMSMLTFGTMLTISNNNALSMWMGLEINMMAFIPMLSEKNNIMSSEASLKYFMIQAMSSSIFIISSMILMNSMNFLFSIMFQYMIIISLMMKLGSAPFHFWFPAIIDGISWFNCMILLSWQKIGPFFILNFFISNPFIIMFIIFSLIVGCIGGLNQTSIRKILTYSSINHIGWMLSSLKINMNMFILYLFIYSFMLLFLTWMFSTFNIMHLNQLNQINNEILFTKIIMLTNMMSLGGLPPFLGFFPKWIIIQNMINSNMMILNMIMIFSSLLTLFYYMKIMISSFLINSIKINTSMFFHNNSKQFFFLISMSISLYMLIYLPFLIWN
uniref:NADH-ubiquinone oxidoreductase chain 2 n=1 Tax=Natula pravdini TaxID=2652438 RepID=A0A856T910_9ORTH|nr:NADH dehydrogenase subunit 2 [Natula pravdini]QFG38970.1 NADH dehydrogenase subunit 2 [Natula pravdini]